MLHAPGVINMHDGFLVGVEPETLETITSSAKISIHCNCVTSATNKYKCLKIGVNIVKYVYSNNYKMLQLIDRHDIFIR